MQWFLPGAGAALAAAAWLGACDDPATAPAARPSSPVAAAAPSPAHQFHFVSNGNFGDAQWFGSPAGGGFTFGQLEVGQGGPTNDPETFLEYSLFQCDATFNCSGGDGFGLIPNRDLAGGSDHQLTLNTNTGEDPDFYTFDGPTGAIALSWQSNGIVTETQSGTFSLSFPGVTYKAQGDVRETTANASGTVIGEAVPSGSYADLGTHHQVDVTLTH